MLVMANSPRPFRTSSRVGPDQPGVGIESRAGVGDKGEVHSTHRLPARQIQGQQGLAAGVADHLAHRDANVAGCGHLAALARWASTAATTSPSTPIPAVNTAQRSTQSISRCAARRAGAVVADQVDQLVGGPIGSGLMPRRGRRRWRPHPAPPRRRAASRRPGDPRRERPAAVHHLVHRAVPAVHDDQSMPSRLAARRSTA